MTASFDSRRLARYRFANRVQAGLLVVGIALLLVLIADLLAGTVGVVASIALALAMLLFAPRATPGLIARLFRARPLAPFRFPALFGVLDDLVGRAGLAARPTVFVTPHAEPLAFSFGTAAKPAIALSAGAMEALDLRRLSGVLAHEIAHLAAGDVAIMMVSEVLARLIRTLALFGLLVAAVQALLGEAVVPGSTVLLLAAIPIASALLQLALSRNREFDADQGAVELTGDPEGLARALEAIELEQAILWRRLLWPYVRGNVPRLLRTHPTTGERIARLEALLGARRG